MNSMLNENINTGDKSSKSHGTSRANTEQWMEHQSVEGPWDGVDGVYGYEYTSSGGAHRGSAYDDTSMAASQGSTKRKTHKHASHKSSSKK